MNDLRSRALLSVHCCKTEQRAQSSVYCSLRLATTPMRERSPANCSR